MMILGEQFYYMHNRFEADCQLSEVVEVVVNEVEVQEVTTDTLEVVSTSTCFLVMAMLDDGVFVSTRPLNNEDYANSISRALIKAVVRQSLRAIGAINPH